MESPNELYQLLAGLKKSMTGDNSKYVSEFVDYGYVELMLEVLEKKYLNKDIVYMACMDLSYLAEKRFLPMIVHSIKGIQALSEVLPKLLQKNSVFAVTACLRYFSFEYRGEGDADLAVLYQRLFKILHRYEGTQDVRRNALIAMGGLMSGGKEAAISKFVELNGTEKVCNLFTKHNGDATVLDGCSCVFTNMLYSQEGARDILQMGGLELTISSVRTSSELKAINTGLTTIMSICLGDVSAPTRALNLGIMDILRHYARVPGTDKALMKTIAYCLCGLFCIDSTFKTPWRVEAAELMNEICLKFPGSKGLRRIADSFNRVEDPKARECREANVCSRAGIGECIKHPGSQPCKKCYVPQFFFRCATCKGGYNKVFCWACKERCHKGHKGDTYFYLGRCDCENEECCHPLKESSSSSLDTTK